MSEITIHTDGASRGNPGAAAIAYVIESDGFEKIEHAEKIGVTTNNQAEYRALLTALTKLGEINPSSSAIRCIADSELMVKQLQGLYKVKDVNIAPHFLAINNLKKELEKNDNSVTFIAVRRAQNKRADELGNLALDGLL